MSWDERIAMVIAILRAAQQPVKTRQVLALITLASLILGYHTVVDLWRNHPYLLYMPYVAYPDILPTPCPVLQECIGAVLH